MIATIAIAWASSLAGFTFGAWWASRPSGDEPVLPSMSRDQSPGEREPIALRGPVKFFPVHNAPVATLEVRDHA